MLGILPDISFPHTLKFRPVSLKCMFLTSAVAIFFARSIRLVFVECRDDVFITTKCHPYMRFSTWRKCVPRLYEQITQSERMALNLLGPVLSKNAYTSTFTDSRTVLLACAVLSSSYHYLATFLFLFLAKRLWKGYLSPFVSIFLFIGISGFRWYCLENNVPVSSYNYPLYIEFRILESVLLAIICIFGCFLMSKSPKSDETLINLIVDLSRDINETSGHN